MYFEKLLNEKQEGESSRRDECDGTNVTQNYRFYRRIQKIEVKFALKKMRLGKVLGPDGIPIKVWRSLGEGGIYVG